MYTYYVPGLRFYVVCSNTTITGHPPQNIYHQAEYNDNLNNIGLTGAHPRWHILLNTSSVTGDNTTLNLPTNTQTTFPLLRGRGGSLSIGPSQEVHA